MVVKWHKSFFFFFKKSLFPLHWYKYIPKKRENLKETRVESRKCHYVLGKSSPQSFCVLISIKGIIYFSHKSVMMAQLHIMVCNFLWSAKRKMKEANLRMSPVMSPQYVSTAPEMATLNEPACWKALSSGRASSHKWNSHNEVISSAPHNWNASHSSLQWARLTCNRTVIQTDL